MIQSCCPNLADRPNLPDFTLHHGGFSLGVPVAKNNRLIEASPKRRTPFHVVQTQTK